MSYLASLRASWLNASCALDESESAFEIAVRGNARQSRLQSLALDIEDRRAIATAARTAYERAITCPRCNASLVTIESTRRARDGLISQWRAWCPACIDVDGGYDPQATSGVYYGATEDEAFGALVERVTE